VGNDYVGLKGDFLGVLGEPDSTALTACCWLYDPPLLLVAFHFRNKFKVVLGKDVGFWDEVKVMLAMEGLHLLDVLPHVVFSGQFCASGEMINSLKFCHVCVKAMFYGRGGPAERPVVFLCFSEAVVFKSVANNFNLGVVHFEVVTFIWRLVRTDCHWIYIGSKD